MYLIALLSRPEVNQHRREVLDFVLEVVVESASVFGAGGEHNVRVLHVPVRESGVREGNECQHDLCGVEGSKQHEDKSCIRAVLPVYELRRSETKTTGRLHIVWGFGMLTSSSSMCPHTVHTE